MRKFLTYFFLITYLFSFTEFKQVLRFPNLIEHYISHKLRNQETTLYSFFKMHYLDEQIVDSDYNQDMKLPFKTHNCASISVLITVPPQKIEIEPEYKKLFIEKRQNFKYSENYYPSVFQKIWQPPKI